MRGVLALLTLALAISTATAQIVHPNFHATNEGTGANSWPFRYTNVAGHYQQSYEGVQFGTSPVTITEISFRYKGDSPVPAGTADFKMTLGYCAAGWNGLSTTFAANFAAPGVKVFDGVWAIAAFNGDPAVPNPFTARLTLTTPFTFNPAQGDLLMDIEMRQSTYSNGLCGSFGATNLTVGVSRLYANTGNPTEPTGSVSPAYGLITEFTSGLIIPYGVGCAGAGGFVPELSMTGYPTGGSQITLGIDKGLGGAMSAILLGPTKASTPLGGGCTLHINPIPISILIPLGGAPGTPGVGSVSLPVVLPATLPPATIYLQVFVGDPAGPIGMSASNGLQVDFQ